ncbi:hypothetical protein SAMN02910369_00695 [Lachnospiraceae bacterium NE2001]|nr:hypothetical protein SAMN02910369_00695 [Lachnospiraceae bacterium NE2001]
MKEVEQNKVDEIKNEQQVNEIKNEQQVDEINVDVQQVVEEPKSDEEIVKDFVDDLFDDKGPQPRVDVTGKTPVSAYSTLSKLLISVDSGFPEFTDEIGSMIVAPAMIEAQIKKMNRTRVYLPNLEGGDSFFYLVEDEAAIKQMEGFTKNYLDLLDRMEKKYPAEQYPANNRIIQIVKKHAQLVADPEYLDNQAAFGDYYSSITKSFIDMPAPMFSKDARSTDFKLDLARYDKFMKDHVFLDQLEEQQNFFIDTVLPYDKKKRAGTLTAEDNVKFNNAYIEHLLKQKSYFETIYGYSYDDKEIACNKTLRTDNQFNMDWRGVRFGIPMRKRAAECLQFLSNGWPAADISLLRQLKTLNEFIDEVTENERNTYSPEDVEAAKKIQEAMADPYQRIMNEELTSPEQRMELLNAIEQPIKDYAALYTKLRKGLILDKKETLADHSILWNFEETKARQVFPEEIGRNMEAYEEYRTTQENPEFEQRFSDTKKEREALFEGANGEQITDVTKLSPEALDEAAALYEKLFRPIFSREAVQKYKELNPDFTELDFFKVGAIPFKQFNRGETFTTLSAGDNADKLLKAEIVRLATDSSIPFSYMTARKNNVTKGYELSETFDIFDAADKEKIVTMKPYLRTQESFKKWYKEQVPQIDVDKIDSEELNLLYQTEFRLTAKGGLVESDSITDIAALKSQADPAIPSEMGLQYVYNIFGSKPKMIKDFLGNSEGEGKVYTSDQYKRNLAPVDSGSFSNNEFALISYLASTDPYVVSEDVYPEAADLSQAQKLFLKSGEWTTSLMGGKIDADKYLSTAVSPVRKEVSEMIRDYEENGADALGETIGTGIKNILNNIRSSNDLNDMSGQFAFNGHILKETMAFLKQEKNKELYDQVMDSFSEPDIEFINSCVKLTEMQDQKQISLNAIKNAQTAGVELDPKALDSHMEAIAAFDHFAAEWDKTFTENEKVLEKDEDYQKLRSDMLTSSSEGVSAENLSKTEEARAEFELYRQSKLGPSQEVIKELGQDSSTYSFAVDAGHNLRAIKDAFAKNIKNLFEAKKVSDRESKTSYPEDITPEKSMEARALRVDAEYRLNEMRKILVNGFDNTSKHNVYDRYNEIAKKKGWPEKQYNENFDNRLMFAYDQEKTEAFVGAILDELATNPYMLEAGGGLAKDIENIKTPLEMELKDIVDYPAGKDIDKIKKGVTKPEDIELLDEVNMSLAEIKKDAGEFILASNDPERAGGILENLGGESMGKFANGQFEKFMTEGFQKKRLAGTDLIYTVPKKPELLNDLKNSPVTVSEDTTVKVAYIINKMKEAGYVDKDSPIENVGKIYAHQKLIDAKVELSNAVKTGDIEKIREANNKYKTEHQKMKEIYDMAENLFPDSKLAPGNVDTMRNPSVPPEFSVRVTTNSRVDGLYQVACLCEKLGITPEQYMENPGQHMINYVQKAIKEKGFNASNKHEGKKDFLNSFRALMEKGASFNNQGSILKDIGIDDPTYFVGRCINGYALLEPDREKVIDLQRYEMLLTNQIANMVDLEQSYESCMNEVVVTSGLPPKTEAAFVEGLKTAFLEGGPIEKRHLPMILTDENGKEIPKPSYKDTLAKPNLYKDIIKSVKKAGAIADDIKYLNCDLAHKAIEDSMFDYLMAHPEDSKKPEYKELEKEALKINKTLGNKYVKESPKAQEYLQWKKDFNTEHNLLYSAAKERDTELNKEISGLQKRMKKLVNGINGDYLMKFTKLADEYKEIIDDRLSELALDYKNHRITEHYFTSRTEALLYSRESFNNPISKVPKFFDETNPSVFKRDNDMINERVRTNASLNPLDSLENFKKNMLQQRSADILDESELSAEEWKSLYKAALIESDIANRPLPENYKEVKYVTAGSVSYSVANEKDTSQDRLFDDYMAGKKTTETRTSFSDRRQELYEEMTDSNGLVAKFISTKKSGGTDANAKCNEYDKQLKDMLCKAIAAESYERFKGNLPKGVSEEVFARRLRNSESFEHISNLVINSLYSASGEHAGKDKDRKSAGQAEYTAENILKLVDDKTILTACSLDQKYLDEVAANKNNPDYKKPKVSPGVRHIKQKFVALQHTEEKNFKQEQRRNSMRPNI